MMSSGVLVSAMDPVLSNKVRPDSPGGYFTLSDSDGVETDEKATMYKLLRSPASKALSESPPRTLPTSHAQRCRSETPPRKIKISKVDVSGKKSGSGKDVAPPRPPPPPTTYTSTLPPPVPKKVGRSPNSLGIQKHPDRRSISSGSVNPNKKPLQRVQPLQIQSPSMLKTLNQPLTPPVTGPYAASSAVDSALSSPESSPESRPSLPTKKKSPPPKASTVGKSKSTVPPSSTTFLKTFQRATCSSTDSLSSITSVSTTPKSKSLFNRKPFIVTTKRTTSEERISPFQATSRTNTISQTNRKSSSPEARPIPDRAFFKTQNRPVPRTFSNGFGQKMNPESKFDLHNSSSRRSSSDTSSTSQTFSNQVVKVKPVQKKSLSEAFEIASSEKIQKFKQSVCLTKAKSVSKVSNVQTRLKNSISSLVGQQKETKSCQPVVLHDTTNSGYYLRNTEDNRSNYTATSGHLSQLSQLSADRLQTWLANPLPSLESKDFSMLEVDILDQYITDMLSFTRGALSTEESQKQYPTPCNFKASENTTPKETSGLGKSSSQGMTEPLRTSTNQPLTLTKMTEPSDEDLNRGVFTEVSFAGTFASSSQKPAIIPRQHKAKPKDAQPAAPIPSPRLKRKAKKEKMLNETGTKCKEEIMDVSSLLDDLCTQSVKVERNIDENRRLSKARSQEVQKPQTLPAQNIIHLQSLCRGYLARQRKKKLEADYRSILCIQHNLRLYMTLKKWPWWNLLVTITPLINAKRSEDQLQHKIKECDSLQRCLSEERANQSSLEAENELLKIKILDLSATLAEQSTTTSLAVSQLDEERFERRMERKENEEKISILKTMLENFKAELAEYNDPDGESTFYKLKCERITKEQELVKKDLEEKHEDEMNFLRKQFEKKIYDSFEDAKALRQALAEWKRKAQNMQAEMKETLMQLEEQTLKQSHLEKRLKKVESELAAAQDDQKIEIVEREKLQTELDTLKSANCHLDEQLQFQKIDLSSKNEVIEKLTKEIQDLLSGSVSEEENSLIKRQKLELEMKLKQEMCENEDLLMQIETLEQTFSRMEMSIIDLKANQRRELTTKDEELEDTRCGFQKKLKALEHQLEAAHEERLGSIREKHELEAKIMTLQDVVSRSADEEQVTKLKRDLKRTKALLKDAQLMLDKSTHESSNKVFIKQLKNQLEDAEFAKTAALKAKQNIEMELSDVQGQLDDILRTKSDMDDKMVRMSREKADLSSQLEDAEEELQEVMKKYKSTVAQLSIDHVTIQEQNSRIAEIEDEKVKLREQNSELMMRIESLEGDSLFNANHSRLEFKVKELEVKLELEKTTRGRLEAQIVRLKEAVDKISNEADLLRTKEASSQDQARKIQRQLRDLREEYALIQQKETEVNGKKNELEKQLEVAEAENTLVKNDLRSALKRIDDLQAVICGQLDSDLESLNSECTESSLQTNQES